MQQYYRKHVVYIIYLRLLILYLPAGLWLNCVRLFYDTSQGRIHKKNLVRPL